MDRFLIESPHTASDCRSIIENVYAEGYLYNCDWGCKVGVHKAWVMIEAEDEKQALLVVPFSLRATATATKIVRFDAETVKSWSSLERDNKRD